jgi:hypothetical protein
LFLDMQYRCYCMLPAMLYCSWIFSTAVSLCSLLCCIVPGYAVPLLLYAPCYVVLFLDMQYRCYSMLPAMLYCSWLCSTAVTLCSLLCCIVPGYAARLLLYAPCYVVLFLDMQHGRQFQEISYLK